MTRPKTDSPSPGKKRPFRKPKLTEYGNLAKLANTKGLNKNDGGGPKPNSRDTGSTA